MAWNTERASFEYMDYSAARTIIVHTETSLTPPFECKTFHCASASDVANVICRYKAAHASFISIVLGSRLFPER